MDQIWTRINELAEANNGFVRTAQVEALGISRPMLRKYTDAGKLEQVRKGLYVLADGMPDEYALLQGQCRDAVFLMVRRCIYGGFQTERHIYMTLQSQEIKISLY